jgi:hypothetical protein
MPPRGIVRLRTSLIVALAVGLAVRLARLAADPLIHPDGPAYLALALDVLGGRFAHVLGGYYSPLYPALVAVPAALGVPLELAGRLTATVAGLASLPLLHVVVRRALGPRAAAAAVLVAAVQPALVKASVQVLPETLAGAIVLAWLAALPRAAAAGALAGAAYLARPEGVLLLPLGLWRLRARRASYAAAAVLVMLPALVALRVETGRWQLSPREARVVPVPGATSLADAAFRAPLALGGAVVRGAAEQTLDDAKALGPLLWIPFVVGVAAAPTRAAVGWPLVVAAAFTALPLALNPSPRYAAPLVPLLLPAVAAGLVALAERLGPRARPVAAALGVALVVQALWVSHPFDAACSREVSDLLLSRYGAGQALVAVDGRFAYRARGRALVPQSNDQDAALALARQKGARLWLTRPAWIRKPWTPPPDVRAVARPCGGTFVLFEID